MKRIIVSGLLCVAAWTTQAYDFTVDTYLASKDNPASQESINAYFIGALNSWVMANQFLDGESHKEFFCVREGQILTVPLARALVDARIAPKTYPRDSEMRWTLFEALADEFPCDKNHSLLWPK